MKLRNKETGEIVEITMPIKNGDGWNISANSLAELNKDWEDYEEPIEFWTINLTTLKPFHVIEKDKWRIYSDEYIDKLKSIGFKFDSEEETEKAVEKLKALTRLRGKGLKILGFNSKDRLIADSDKKWRFSIEAEIDSSVIDNEDDCKMIDLLFGGDK